MSARFARSVRQAAALAMLALVGCGSSSAASDRSVKSPEPEVPMPAGNGTKRALVLVEGAAPPPSKAVTPQDAELSTSRIVQKVLGGGER